MRNQHALRSALRSVGLRLGLLVALCCLTGLALVQTVSADGRQQQLEFEPVPYWVSSATWNPAETSLLVVDVLREQILSYPVDGGGGEVVELKGVDLDHPSILRRAGAGYWLEEGDGLMIRLDEQFRAEEKVDVIAASKKGERRIASINDWVLVGDAGRELLAVGDWVDGDRWSGAVMRIPLDSPHEFEVLEDVTLDGAARSFFGLGFRLLASSGNKGYYVLMEARPVLVEATFQEGETPKRQLDVPLPRAPNVFLSEAGQVANLFDTLERSPRLVGIYAAEDELQLVSKLEQKGRLQWFMTSVDATSGKPVGRVALRVSSPHLLAVAGEKRWAFIHKGHVISLGQQTIPGATIVSAAELSPGNR